uniref:Uncharacterized protein n=1 Tax=Romanomermis culicivorax TaxID=13658 RepID=A0A915JV62_ROMCU
MRAKRFFSKPEINERRNGHLALVYFVTAFVPSLTACLANSPGNNKRTAIKSVEVSMTMIWLLEYDSFLLRLIFLPPAATDERCDLLTFFVPFFTALIGILAGIVIFEDYIYLYFRELRGQKM